MRNLLLGLVCALALLSCNDNLVYTRSESTTGGSWDRDEVMTFTFKAPDTIQSHNLYFNIRNDDRFPYSNLFVIAAFNTPGGETSIDTLEYEMARPDGTWMGKGQGSIKENKLWFKEAMVFPDTGEYTVTLQHAMRKNGDVEGVVELPGITDVGLEIEKQE
ncbi:gliding motility lipoprotein GldH [Zeaxanthinibacter enoshimensis]|uniref:Gliding motility-associated lipoprotein GldH n=1 Tax=Zeaxanthinibacter enoshimensis TaxID=392009 RepID=A0A4R6TRF6_9FLAO|nr:gliding motility lipoprotein GldH [Zeaxanthinibacter enoshimensis]TDQ32723.1 gliding motility-associated lipoprotein GldH [Zeaxanthinibacter enoshimensis]